MLPTCYQTVLRSHLSESQYLTLQWLILLLQSHRQVQLARLASVFPQPIHYSSRIRNLQRFLVLPQLNVRLLWFPIIKYWLSEAFKSRQHNRHKRRALKKLKHTLNGYLVIAIDRTQWQERNLIMVTIVWGKHALPLYWEQLNKTGSSSLKQQQRLLKTALMWLNPHSALSGGKKIIRSRSLD